MLPERFPRLFFVVPAAIAIALTLAVATTASAAVVQSCTGGTPLATGALIAEDGDQCGDRDGGEEYDWAAIADDVASFPDDTIDPDGSAFVSSGKENDTSGWDFGSSNVNDKVNLYASWAFSETIGSDLFLYLAFQRQAPNNPANASANVDFELNQASAADPDSFVTNPQGEKVIKRQGNGIDDSTPDDLLFVYDWKGNDDIALQLCRWAEGPDDNSTSYDDGWLKGTWNCEALSSTEAEGEVNDGGDIASFLPDAVETLDGTIRRREFGESAFNLSAALGLDDHECVSFGAFHTRTRESGSLSANLVDLIPPEPVSVSNCGTLIVEKQTNPDDAKTTKTEFPFATTGIPEPPAEASQQDVTAFDLADDEQQTITNVEANDGGTGTYDVTEGTVPGDYDLDRIECRSSDDPTVLDDLTTYVGATAKVKVAAGETITCTFFNEEKGSVAIAKVTDPDPDPSDPDEVFTFQAPLGLTDIPVSNGQTSLPQAVAPGQYTFTEDAAPGWAFGSVTCDDDTSSAPSSGANGEVDFDVEAGEDVVCTVVNRLKPSGIDIVKDGPAFAYHGDQVTFTYAVTNPSEQSIHDVVVTDDKCSPVTLTGKTEGANDTGAGFLDPGDTWRYACTMTMGAHADGEQDPHVNIGTVTGKDEREKPVSDTDPHSTDLLHPGISLDKSGPATGIRGENVTYSLVTTNTGDTAMAQANVNLTDPRCDLALPERVDVNGDATPDVFHPGDTWTFRCTASTTADDAQVVNVADVCGTDVNGRTVCARDEAVTLLARRAVEPQRQPSGSARLAGPTRCVSGPFSLRITGDEIASVTVYVGSRRVARRTGAGNVRIDPRTTGYAVQRVRVVVQFTADSATSPKTIRATFQRCPKKKFRPVFTG